ncbi:putative phenazine biosynthesis protein [Gordonia hirsuta DSM 44140 = NBRC 16056]|uniref:Putative phenazine biosynthesis protein n=1 Tax=Gordonia hirsuta DSM 44140 = NBRC 16056 TaxID=1121927 RepID=L7L920_9ACTN|nr:putative phenazine biosynthesis protein [Gordonia hirsuta DSM 44140 = NBRC 16056]
MAVGPPFGGVRRLKQVDVFGDDAGFGNPVAVVLDAHDLSDGQLAAFARWTNLSETTFVLPPTDPAAHYRLRIFTPGGELPFAGHPTLGSAHAWLTARPGHRAATAIGPLVQECGIGLVTVRIDDDPAGPHTPGRYAFAAPPLTRSGAPDGPTLERVRTAFDLQAADVVAAQWVSNGPPWLGLLLRDAQSVLAADPDLSVLGPDDFVGLIGPWHTGGPAGVDYEVRAFVPGMGVPEDPVTGSLNAGLAVWLRSAGIAPASYLAAQGTVLGRTGRVAVTDDGTEIWVGGRCVTVIDGSVML